MGYYFLENIMASNFDISIVQGDTLKWAMYLRDTGGTAYNLGGCTLSMQVRKSYYPTTLISSYSINVPIGSTMANSPQGLLGGLSASAIGGTIYISIGSTYTSNFSSEANAKYDIQLTNPTGNDTTTILRGSISVLPEVTRL
jgi:hypothetical protein